MGVTQREIAKALNISVMTVHRALSETGYISEELKEKVLAYAQEVNYRPHRGAQALVRKRTHRLALFSIDQPDFFWDDIARGISIAQEQISPFGFSVAYLRIPAGPTEAYLRSVSASLDEGTEAVAIVNNPEFEMDRIFDLLESRSIPYITFNIDAPERRRHCFVGPDYIQEGILAADIIGKILAGKGRVGILVSPDMEEGSVGHRIFISDIRRQGFRSWVDSEYPGLTCMEISIDYSLPEERVQADFLAWLREQGRSVDALYCIPSYQVAIARAVTEAGLGGQLPIVTFDLSTELKELIRSGIITATVCQKPVHQGYYAVKLLEALTENAANFHSRELHVSAQLVLKGNLEIEEDLLLIAEPALSMA
jgi:LacI family transcriptional regulator